MCFGDSMVERLFKEPSSTRQVLQNVCSRKNFLLQCPPCQGHYFMAGSSFLNTSSLHLASKTSQTNLLQELSSFVEWFLTQLNVFSAIFLPKTVRNGILSPKINWSVSTRTLRLCFPSKPKKSLLHSRNSPRTTSCTSCYKPQPRDNWISRSKMLGERDWKRLEKVSGGIKELFKKLEIDLQYLN